MYPPNVAFNCDFVLIIVLISVGQLHRARAVLSSHETLPRTPPRCVCYCGAYWNRRNVRTLQQCNQRTLVALQLGNTSQRKGQQHVQHRGRRDLRGRRCSRTGYGQHTICTLELYLHRCVWTSGSFLAETSVRSLTSKIIYFHYLKKLFLHQSIQQIF